jgi:tRNA-guanine family transglycosylase
MYNINWISNFQNSIHDDYRHKDCSIFLDSGGFQQINKMNPFSFETIEEIVVKLARKNPDICTPLDYPQRLWLKRTEKIRRWTLTLTSLEKFLKFADEYSLKSEIVPIIHGYSERSISKAIDDLRKLRDWDKIALGGQVDLIKRMTFYPELGKLFCKNVKTVRDKVGENVWIHVLGAGGMRTLPMVYILGANSADSSGWETSAAHGRVIIPLKGGSKYLPTRRKEPQMSEEEIRLFESCTCPVCREIGTDKFVYFDKSKELRLIHNFFTSLNLETELQEVIKESDSEVIRWIKERYRNSSIWPIIEYSISISKLVK